MEIEKIHHRLKTQAVDDVANGPTHDAPQRARRQQRGVAPQSGEQQRLAMGGEDAEADPVIPHQYDIKKLNDLQRRMFRRNKNFL